ncbi:hypothetical protein FN846DRAFT_908310 [Sphaerosporella brunnea]|uniref:Fungal N-terminal domain-containing protein n=1 Tax=Sphaerosporella brunnea TaxID=1250544 RepID=A0A5J5ETZ6_9PEZI|nr:hypothetical protein FN846DRAFT_908310 [Sphaerosporella brunnea]
MDPLSVASSVVGLLSATAAICSALETFISSSINAPILARTVKLELHDVRAALCRLQPLILRQTGPALPQESQLDVEQLLVTLTGCVCTVSELEKEVDDLKIEGEGIKLLDRARWALKETSIASILGRLQSHKASLTLIILVLTCTSADAQRENLDRLSSQVSYLAEVNAQLLDRMRAAGPDSATVPAPQIIEGEKEFISPPYESDLRGSRVYKKIYRSDATAEQWDSMSITSKSTTSRWTEFSGFSLGDLSNVSIVRLPLYAKELYNSAWYDGQDGNEVPQTMPRPTVLEERRVEEGAKTCQYFSDSFERLLESVKEWSRDFSTASAGRRSMHLHSVLNEAARDRIESVMLDDRGVRRMLKDEERRHFVLTAICMRLIWEFVFTKYLFGLETETRQNLLTLERTLVESGERRAVHRWRTTTLSLLLKTSSHSTTLTSAVESVVTEIATHLNHILPPPPDRAPALISSLRNLVSQAAKLAIEMRTSEEVYVMKRQPLPEYDDHGEVSDTVPFNPRAMRINQEDISSNGHIDLPSNEANTPEASVKLVLFPLVVVQVSEPCEDESVVFPMQVLVNIPQYR